MSGSGFPIEFMDELEEGVCLIDAEDTITAINEACAASFGCRREDAVGVPLTIFADISTATVWDLGDGGRAAVFPPRRENSELEMFAYTISHDLKEPLRAMSVFATALAEDYADEIDDEGREYIGYITQGAQAANRMVDDLLAFTRIGRGGITKETIGLDVIVDDALSALREKIGSTGAVIAVDAPLGDAALDRRAFGQAFQHLLVNAITHVAPGTKPRVGVAVSRKDGWLTLAVSDNGVGIAEDQQARVFGIFSRLGGEHDAGSGIGLAIAKKAMRLHGGDVTLESEPGKGSVFRLVLPEKG